MSPHTSIVTNDHRHLVNSVGSFCRFCARFVVLQRPTLMGQMDFLPLPISNISRSLLTGQQQCLVNLDNLMVTKMADCLSQLFAFKSKGHGFAGEHLQEIMSQQRRSTSLRDPPATCPVTANVPPTLGHNLLLYFTRTDGCNQP